MVHISTHDKGTCVLVDDVRDTGGTIDVVNGCVIYMDWK